MRYLASVVFPAAAAALLAAAPAEARSWRPGDRVEAAPEMMDNGWERCVVVELMSTGDIGVACGAKGTEYVVQARWVRAPGAGGAGDGGEAPRPRGGARDSDDGWLDGPTPAQERTARLWKVGDKVEASPDMMDSDWQRCIVVKIHETGDVGVACGRQGTVFVVQARWVRSPEGR